MLMKSKRKSSRKCSYKKIVLQCMRLSYGEVWGRVRYPQTLYFSFFFLFFFLDRGYFTY
uniref:Uncharacterized protein n=1 Tax=Rhizophora mucronata TaxID=61149 RepID=A0A2P2R535_RHIMU